MNEVTEDFGIAVFGKQDTVGLVLDDFVLLDDRDGCDTDDAIVIFGNVITVEEEFLGVDHEDALATGGLDGVVNDGCVYGMFSPKGDVGFEIVEDFIFLYKST